MNYSSTEASTDWMFYLCLKIELLIGRSAARRIEIAVFASIMTDCQLNWTELFRQYVGKNVLNFFRQDNGYKEVPTENCGTAGKTMKFW